MGKNIIFLNYIYFNTVFALKRLGKMWVVSKMKKIKTGKMREEPEMNYLIQRKWLIHSHIHLR